MVEMLGFDGWSPKAVSVMFGLAIGLCFGLLAQQSKFCLRRSIVADEPIERRSASGVWAAAFAVAVFGTCVLMLAGIVDFSEHRFHGDRLALVALMVGGLLFGAGMVLARGCASRLTVLSGSGNLRAVSVLLVFAIVSHAVLKGALAPMRVWLAGFTVDFPLGATLTGSPVMIVLTAAVLTLTAVIIAARSGAPIKQLLMGGAIGALVPLSWLITSVVLADDFDPIPQESLAFTSSASQTLFWWIAGTAIAPGFGVGVLGGTLLGSFVAAVATREFVLEGFNEQTDTGRYLLGGALMGVGGVLAGGCTVGAGLSGISMLSTSALIAFASIIAGAQLTNWLLRQRSFGFLQLSAARA